MLWSWAFQTLTDTQMAQIWAFCGPGGWGRTRKESPHQCSPRTHQSWGRNEERDGRYKEQRDIHTQGLAVPTKACAKRALEKVFLNWRKIVGLWTERTHHGSQEINYMPTETFGNVMFMRGKPCHHSERKQVIINGGLEFHTLTLYFPWILSFNPS